MREWLDPATVSRRTRLIAVALLVVGSCLLVIGGLLLLEGAIWVADPDETSTPPGLWWWSAAGTSVAGLASLLCGILMRRQYLPRPPGGRW